MAVPIADGKKSGRQALWTDCSLGEPFQPLFARSWRYSPESPA